MLSNFITRIRNAVLDRTLLEFTASAKNRSLYLTFDDGPSPEVTRKLLDTLDKYNAKATFFVIGREVEKYPDIAKQISEAGHTIGNHSFSHPPFGRLSPSQQDDEVEKAQRAIETHLNISSPLFRVPRGRWSVPMLLRMKKRKIRCIHWAVDSLDYDDKDAERITQRIIDNGIKPGQILLFHDDSPLCLEVMDLLLPKLITMNFNLAAMDYHQ
ncbi:polysaccharide deacetylase family protein [Alteromonas halophila]|uniref:NodB homology domain-containing protein n=1 Tax=Alteromonas halophila TaxID=516698 RepID=A0A918JME3_9ALTE|nr:polysaccharide deacetylase family protein [Alteromonas halophila]GGW87018.1 hypothetical protein GCM10007391_21030 [Alteromonas halophila]